MSVSKYTEEFFEAMRIAYYGDETAMLSEYLRGECRLLFALNVNDGEAMQPGQIAKLLNISTARVASILRTLEAKGMIVRNIYSNDRRKTFVNITEKGTQYIEAKRANITGYFDRSFEKLTEAEREEFIRLTRKLTDRGGSGDDEKSKK